MSDEVQIYALIAPPLYMEPRYVGVTVRSLRARLSGHKTQAFRQNANNHKCRWIRKAISEDCTLEIILLRTVPIECWEEEERDAIASYPNLTNACDGGGGVLNPCQETREKLRAAQRRMSQNPEVRKKLSAAHKGVPKSLEHRAALSRALKGRVIDGEWAKKIAAANLGRKHGPEHRRKTSEAGRGRVKSPETLAKLSASLMGHGCTEETKAKMRASSRIRWDRWQSEHGR